MSRKTKVWLVIAASLVIAGCVIFSNVMMQLGWDFTKLSTTQYETNEYQISDFFENMSIVTSTADIEFIPSDNQKSVVVCYEDEKEKHTVTVKDNTLLIEQAEDKRWYEYVGVNFNSPEILVYIPQREYDTLSIKNSTGKITLNDLRCKNLTLNGSTGNVLLNNVISSEKISVKISTGNVNLQNCDATEIFIQTDTGNVKGNLLSEKVFMAQTDTGRISVPKTQSGGKCEITTDTGNIKITVE